MTAHITISSNQTSCNTLHHTTTHYNTLQHTATHCNTLQRAVEDSTQLDTTRLPTTTLPLQTITHKTSNSACAQETRAHAPKTLILRPHSCCSGTRFASTGWQRLIECLKLQVIFRKRVTNYRALLRKMTCKDKASYGSSTPCTHTTHVSSSHHFTDLTPDTHSFLALTTIRNQE